LTQTLIEITYPAGQSFISFILEYFDQQRKRTKKYKTIIVPFGVWFDVGQCGQYSRLA
jgi:hypothetical protein